MSLQFSDTTTKNGLIQDCEITLFGDNGYTQITSNTNRLHNFTQLINRALDQTVTLIMQSDGRWQFDDNNYTDFPIGTTTLVNGQQDYTMSNSHLAVLRVEVLGIDGKYYKVEPFDPNDVQNQAMSEYLNTASRPLKYDVQSNSVLLYPKPQTDYVTLAAGLKVYFQREPSYFVYTDTTKVPGFNSLFHRLVSKFACLDYAQARQMPIKEELEKQCATLVAILQNFYAKRQPDERLAFRTVVSNWN